MYCFSFYFCNLKYSEKQKFKNGYTMDNIKDRLAHIIRAKNLTASQFAELMGIQPSNVSHLLNGRNKPSLDFLIKLKEVFPEYSFDWIIMGKKPITINDPNPKTGENNDKSIEDFEDLRVMEFDDIDENIHENEIVYDKNNNDVTKTAQENRMIEKILLIYADKTFEIINPR